MAMHAVATHKMIKQYKLTFLINKRETWWGAMGGSSLTSPTRIGPLPLSHSCFRHRGTYICNEINPLTKSN